ncbi:MAG TPA: hypothetical protein VHD33_03640 [Legionellaceae bacterium]|nr:hypothetical protein [Legionellaceae bacterium]
MEEPTKEQAGSKTNLYVIFAAVLVVIVIGVGYYHFFGPSAVPDEFFSVYAYQDNEAKKTQQSMLFDYSAISKAIAAKDDAAAASAAKDDLIQSLKNQATMEDIQKKETDMKLMLSQVNDSTLRDKITNLIGQLDNRNNQMQTVISAQTNTFTVLRDHFGAAAVGSKGPDIPQNIDTVIQTSQATLQSIAQLQTTIDFDYDEIVKLAGVDTTVSQTADTIRMNLSATPQKDPTITDFPTPSPTPSLAPTPTETATPSATTTPEASASAE